MSATQLSDDSLCPPIPPALPALDQIPTRAEPNRANHSPLAVPALAPCSLDLSIVIPTYNGATRLPQVLNALAHQTATAGLTWEVLVCDNNSSDQTAAIVRDYQQRNIIAAPLHYCLVRQPGAAPARQHGVSQARGQLIAFLDDDTLPAPDWVISAHRFAQDHPDVGAFGSRIQGDFEQPLPADLAPLACYLAVIDRGDQPKRYIPKNKVLPPGAGLVVRRHVWLQAVPSRLFLNHQGRDAGLASEDLEAVLHIQNQGWSVWYAPSLRIQHQIPAHRLQRPAMLGLLRCIGQSRYYIRLLRHPHWQWPLWILLYFSLDLSRLLLHYLHHPQPSPRLPLSLACQRQYLRSTLRSPSFLAQKAWRDRHS